jgi:hypothetical protein
MSRKSNRVWNIVVAVVILMLLIGMLGASLGSLFTR